MSYSTLTATLNNSSATNVTRTITTSSFPDAQAAIQSMQKLGGFTDDNGVYYPMSAVLKITAS